MDTDKVIKEMENRGYTVADESGVLMITGRTLNLDEAMVQIRKELESLDFHGSWGTKGYPKGKVPKMPKPVFDDMDEEKAPDSGDMPSADDGDETDDYLDENDDSLDEADEALNDFDHIPDNNDFDSDDFGQMSFNFL